ncbi:hypothetical protein HK099_000397 [Clydaea vesicula]|uniref:Protein kinase domain-containing protein n=1 Tax=Clydaea vesicula TaxID=447962 RepID=A0AAD5TUR6_9FUNG|nr:hypothetical protein HK099_000397 [Clydaea vesicula]
MEFCDGGELFNFILKNGKMDELVAKRIFNQICEALNYCHQNSALHRDLKLENILLNGPDLEVKIIDFGFTTNDNNKLLEKHCGSIGYCSPEILKNVKLDGFLADIWSLGVCLYTIVSGYLPFDADEENIMISNIKNIEYSMPDHLSNECQDLIKKIFKPEKDRISLKDILQHSWLPPRPKEFLEKEICVGSFNSCPHSLKTLLLEDFAHKQIFKNLENLGFPIKDIISSVEKDLVDHFSGLYYLLIAKQEKIAKSNSPEQFSLDLDLKNLTKGSSQQDKFDQHQGEISPAFGKILSPFVSHIPKHTFMNNISLNGRVEDGQNMLESSFSFSPTSAGRATFFSETTKSSSYGSSTKNYNRRLNKFYGADSQKSQQQQQYLLSGSPKFKIPNSRFIKEQSDEEMDSLQNEIKSNVSNFNVEKKNCDLKNLSELNDSTQDATINETKQFFSTNRTKQRSMTSIIDNQTLIDFSKIEVSVEVKRKRSSLGSLSELVKSNVESVANSVEVVQEEEEVT